MLQRDPTASPRRIFSPTESRDGRSPLAQRFACIWRHPRKGVDQRVYVLQEIIETEDNYINDLRACIEVFLHELRGREDVLKPHYVASIFSNIEELCELHEDLFEMIESRLVSESEDVSIAHISCIIGEVFFKAAAELIGKYGKYCLCYYEGLDLMKELRSKYPLFNSFLEIQETHPSVKGLRIADYLIKPIQRICKYPLLFRELVKSEDEDGTDDDYSYVKDTLTALTRVVELINKNKREKENKDKLRSIEESIDGFNLKERLATEPRIFVKEGSLIKYNKMMKAQTRYCFLTSDLIVYTKEKAFSSSGKKYIFKGSIGLESSVVGRNLASFKLRKDIECGFQITQLAKKREYYFSASSEREKNEWIEDLEKIIDDFRNADVKQSRALAELWKEAEEQAKQRGLRAQNPQEGGRRRRDGIVGPGSGNHPNPPKLEPVAI